MQICSQKLPGNAHWILNDLVYSNLLRSQEVSQNTNHLQSISQSNIHHANKILYIVKKAQFYCFGQIESNVLSLKSKTNTALLDQTIIIEQKNITYIQQLKLGNAYMQCSL